MVGDQQVCLCVARLIDHRSHRVYSEVDTADSLIAPTCDQSYRVPALSQSRGPELLSRLKDILEERNLPAGGDMDGALSVAGRHISFLQASLQEYSPGHERLCLAWRTLKRQ